MRPKIATKKEWLKERRALLRDEKALIRYKDSIAERRRNLPWVKVEQEYVFDTNEGKRSLQDLFNGRSQLIVYHFMFGPDWDEGCVGCSQVADTFNFAIPHIENRDVTMIAISRARLEMLNAYKERMGWSFEWASSRESEFNYDFDVSYKDPGLSRKRWNFQTVEAEMEEMHGVSVFAMYEGELYHTYSCYARALELMMVHLQYLDLCPKGRQDGVFEDKRRV
ncbi:MAG: DUF899 domain-containing protein [Pseudomonadales bacterium]